jgi:RNA ligase
MFAPDLLQQHLDDKLISAQKHPTADLWIYNYTPLAQYQKVWNEVTLACRGLMLDAAGQVVARPFRKFFNLEEHAPGDLPLDDFEVYEKLDGSLGILYWLGDQPQIATRGSFVSDQAEWATRFLHARYAHLLGALDRRHTYLFEIIYPANRIVVDYGPREDLVLLAVVDTRTGADLPLPSLGFPLAKRYDGVRHYHDLRLLAEDNREGFVIKFTNGFRVKVKFAEYVRLHRLLTQVSSKTVWEALRFGHSFEALLERVPDEFYDWVRATRQGLLDQYAAIEQECRANFRDLGDRKATAAYFLSLPHHRVLFSMLDGRDYSTYIWRQVEPPFAKPFMTGAEE